MEPPLRVSGADALGPVEEARSLASRGVAVPLSPSVPVRYLAGGHALSRLEVGAREVGNWQQRSLDHVI